MKLLNKIVAVLLLAVMLIGCVEDVDNSSADTTSDEQSALSSEYSSQESEESSEIGESTEESAASSEESSHESHDASSESSEESVDSSEDISKEPVSEMPIEDSCRLTSLKLSADDNPAIAKTLEFYINEDKKCATLTLDYQNYADIYTLADARLAGEAKEGSVSFPTADENGGVNLNADAVCRVTDEAGKTCDYRLIVDRTVYQLPIVNITLANGKKQSQIDRDDTIPMTFSLDCSGANEFSSIANISGKIRGRGNSTWKWDKKPYKIKLDDKQSLLGMDANRDWILLANYADKSLIRNTLAYDMGRLMTNLVWTPHQYPVDLFVNGKYCGVYSLGEHMEVAKSRVDIEEHSTEVDTDYFLEIGGMNPSGDINGVHYFHTDSRLVCFATYKSPDYQEITSEQKKYLKDYFEKAEEAIKAGEGYEEYIDVDSFVDWILLYELCYNTDGCFRRSCFMVKEKGGKIRMGPAWDFDFAFGNFLADNQQYNDWVTVGKSDNDAYIKYNWCTYLMRSPEFCKRLEERWNELRDSLLDVAETTIDKYSELLDGSQQENFDIWRIWDERIGYQSRPCYKANSFEKQIQYLRDFLKKRAAWMDEAIPRLPH